MAPCISKQFVMLGCYLLPSLHSYTGILHLQAVCTAGMLLFTLPTLTLASCISEQCVLLGHNFLHSLHNDNGILHLQFVLLGHYFYPHYTTTMASCICMQFVLLGHYLVNIDSANSSRTVFSLMIHINVRLSKSLQVYFDLVHFDRARVSSFSSSFPSPNLFAFFDSSSESFSSSERSLMCLLNNETTLSNSIFIFFTPMRSYHSSARGTSFLK
jgi:hypothetical protein